MARLYLRSARRSRARKKREGAALLIALFVMMIATGAAVFAMQSTQGEQRAAGSLHQAVRTRFVAEAATVGVLSLCYQLGTAGCTDIKRAVYAGGATEENAERTKYALPDAGTREVVYRMSTADMGGTGFTGNAWLASDADMSGGGAAMPYTPSFVTIMERWELPHQDESRQRYRLIVSTYGALNIADQNGDGKPDDVTAAGETRAGHESISATRAFFDVR